MIVMRVAAGLFLLAILPIAAQQRSAPFRLQTETSAIEFSLPTPGSGPTTIALAPEGTLWFTAQVLPESCLPIFKAMFDKQMLTHEDSWSRVRLALENGSLSGTRMLLMYLPAAERPEMKVLEAISKRPQRYLDKDPLLLKTRGQRELAIYALYKTAESWPEIAADRCRG